MHTDQKWCLFALQSNHTSALGFLEGKHLSTYWYFMRIAMHTLLLGYLPFIHTLKNLKNLHRTEINGCIVLKCLTTGKDWNQLVSSPLSSLWLCSNVDSTCTRINSVNNNPEPKPAWFREMKKILLLQFNNLSFPVCSKQPHTPTQQKWLPW